MYQNRIQKLAILVAPITSQCLYFFACKAHLYRRFTWQLVVNLPLAILQNLLLSHRLSRYSLISINVSNRV